MNMAKKLLLLMSVLLLLLTSCDENKGKIEELANQFVTAVNGNDKATVYDMFPDVKNIETLSLPDSIPMGKISVSKDEKTGYYIASINNARDQKILFVPESEGKFTVKDTYCIFQLDSGYNELALKSGVPMKKIPDLTIAKLFEEGSEYLNFIFNKYASVTSGNLVTESSVWQSQGGWYPSVTVTQPIRNVGQIPIKGDEYTVEFLFYCPEGTCPSQKSVEYGVDLEPGEAYTYTVFPGSYFHKACAIHDFAVSVSFTYKNQSPLDALLQYAKFTGNEYDEFMKGQPKESDKKKADKKSADKKNDGGKVSGDDVTKVKVTGKNVRLRTTPDINDGNIIKKSDGTNLHPNKGEVLECLGQAGDFYRVKFNGKEAYISKQFAEPQ